MRARPLPSTLVFALALVACQGSPAPAPGPGPAPGAESFLSQPPGSTGGFANAGTAGGAIAPAAGAPASASSDASAAARAVEEADLYQLGPDGKTLYVLNAYRGLEIVDLSTDPPALLGRVAATGTPLDLYLRGRYVYFTVSDSVAWAWAAGPAAATPQGGSQLRAVDVTDPRQPLALPPLSLEGSAVETRLIGDVLYVFSHRYGWWDLAVGAPVAVGAVGAGAIAAAAGTSSNLVYLASFDLSDPAAPRAVARVDVDATGWEAHAHFAAATQGPTARVTLAQSGWDASGPVTRFTFFDVSDPSGAIQAGTSFETAGRVPDRWAMDLELDRGDPLDASGAPGLFRAVLAPGWNAGARLQLWASPSASTATPLGSVTVGTGESLTAARFDGRRAYVVTARSVDPLFVVDTADPRQPKVQGFQDGLPGQLDFVEPRGTRLLALGHTNEAGQPWQLAVSLFDVTDPAAPRMTSRVLLGDGSGSVAASRDDMRKAFGVFDELGLVLVPFQSWNRSLDAAGFSQYAWASGVQLVDVDLGAAPRLTRRGFVAHPGPVARAFPVPGRSGVLAALSDQRLQLIDASDRDRPRETAGIDLARSVVDIAFVGGKAIELAGDWWLGDTAVVVTEQDDPDAPAPLATVPVPAPQARMFPLQSSVWVLAQDWRSTGPQAWLQGIDLSDPVHPQPGPKLEAAPAAQGYGGGWGWGDEAVALGKLLAVHRQLWRAVPLGTGVVAPAPAPAGGGGSIVAAEPDEILLYDLADVTAPRLAGKVALPTSDWAWGLGAAGGMLWITHFEWSPDGSGLGRYWLDRVDVSRPEAPQVLPKVNVPGVLVGAAAGGRRIYTLETIWPVASASAGSASSGGSGGVTGGGAGAAGGVTTAPAVAPQPLSYLHALDLTSEGTARLAASVRLDGYPSGAALEGGRAYVTLGDWASTATSRLVAVGLAEMAVDSSQGIETWSAAPLAATGGKLFVTAYGSLGSSILIYGLDDPGRPALEQSVATPGWVRTVAVAGGHAYLPCGPYGVPRIPLAP